MFNEYEWFVTVGIRVAVLLASHTLYDIVLIYSRKLNLYAFIS